MRTEAATVRDRDNTLVEVRPITGAEIGIVESQLDFDWANAQKHLERLNLQQRGEAVYLVAWHDRLPAGHGLLKWAGAEEEPMASRLVGCPDIEDLFVHPAYRSRGTGSQILSHAEGLAGRQGFDLIGLGVDIGNDRARLLYERLGYRDAALGEYANRWEYIDRSGRTKWAEEHCVYMVKRLE